MPGCPTDETNTAVPSEKNSQALSSPPTSPLQTRLRAELGAELYEAAAERGQLRELEEAATSILEDLGEHSGAEA